MTSMTAVLRLTLRACSKTSLRFMLKSWHRTIGLIASVFLLALTITGLALMQTDALNLDSRYISSEKLLDWYGVRPAPPPLSFKHGQNWLTQVGNRLYFDRRSVTSLDGQIVGVVPLDGEILVATTNAMMIVTTDGVIAERIEMIENTAAGMPRQIGIDDAGQVIVRGDTSAAIFDSVLGHVVAGPVTPPVRWSLERSLPQDIGGVLASQYRGTGLSLERVLLDLHTGRLFGPIGTMLVNTASILLLVLVISGFVLWLGRNR